MTKLVEDAVAGITPDSAKNTVAIFQLLDNTVYMTRTEDGGPMPCRKEAGSNKYHVDGEVMLAPKELLKNSINITKSSWSPSQDTRGVAAATTTSTPPTAPTPSLSSSCS